MFNLNIICEGDNHYFMWSGNSCMDTCPPNQRCTCGKYTMKEYEALFNYPVYQCPVCNCESTRKLIKYENEETWVSVPYCPFCKLSFWPFKDENIPDWSKCRPYVHNNE